MNTAHLAEKFAKQAFRFALRAGIDKQQAEEIMKIYSASGKANYPVPPPWNICSDADMARMYASGAAFWARAVRASQGKKRSRCLNHLYGSIKSAAFHAGHAKAANDLLLPACYNPTAAPQDAASTSVQEA